MIILTIEHVPGFNEYKVIESKSGKVLHGPVRVKWDDKDENWRVTRELDEIGCQMDRNVLALKPKK